MAAAEKEDNMAFINLGTDSDLRVLNGFKHKNIIRLQKIQEQGVFIFYVLWEILRMIYTNRKSTIVNLVFHVLMMLGMALFRNKFTTVNFQ
jgi:hypothetical protein